jgi:hypothetical protein
VACLLVHRFCWLVAIGDLKYQRKFATIDNMSSLLASAIRDTLRTFPGMKVFIHLQILTAKNGTIPCPFGRNIEVTSRLRSKKGAVRKRTVVHKKLQKQYEKVSEVVLKNRIRSSNYKTTNSKYYLVAHICDLKCCDV